MPAGFTAQVSVRLTREEYAQLETLARSLRTTLSGALVRAINEAHARLAQGSTLTTQPHTTPRAPTTTHAPEFPSVIGPAPTSTPPRRAPASNVAEFVERNAGRATVIGAPVVDDIDTLLASN